MPIYSGIDEAGLGPILGPFCGSLTTFESPTPLKELLEDQQKKLFYVDDSKKVFQGKNGFKRLEENVLSFYALLTGSIPEDFVSFIPTLKSLWYREPLQLPVTSTKSQIEDNVAKIDTIFKSRGIKILDIKRTAVSAKDFNTLIDTWENKSIVCQKIIEPLLVQAFTKPDSTIVIDKQGGRKFYKNYLQELIPDKEVKTVFEEDKHSKYTVGSTNISFMAKADSSSFTVALASMFSKYMRELAMNAFNRYWYSLNSNVKPTAGYYTDGMRFLKDLEINNMMPEEHLIKRKK